MKSRAKCHKPKVGDSFYIGTGKDAILCDVTNIKGKVVEYCERSDGSKRDFNIGSPLHRLAGWAV